MIERFLQGKLDKKLSQAPAVALLGPRQVGKTTLAHEIANTYDALYLDLENPSDFQKLSDPGHYLDLHADKLVILDEIQRYPQLFSSLRGTIDKRRRQGQRNRQFLFLGSASNDLLKQSSESLAGRIQYLELGGLNALETNAKDLYDLWTRGGFPESYLSATDEGSYDWRVSFIRTYVERDIPQLGSRIPATTLTRFWTMLAHYQGEPFNASKLAGSLGVEGITVSRYLDMMVDLLLVRRLEPWFGNVKKRLVKSPRVYVRDTGVVHALLRVADYEQLLGNPVKGKSWEGFVIENIISVLPQTIRPFYYRTSAGAEIDLLLELAPDRYWAIDIKASMTPTVQKGYHKACEDLQVEKKFVVYPGLEVFPLNKEISVVPLTQIMKELLTLP